VLEKPFRVETRGFKTLVSLSHRGGNEEFIKKLSEEVMNDDRFSLHYATSGISDRVTNLGLLVSYASHIKADMIIRINCHNSAISDVQLEETSNSIYKPIVKVRARELRDINDLCGEMACIRAFLGDEEEEIVTVLREIQKRMEDSISVDFIIESLRDLNTDRASLGNKMRELRGYMKKRTFFVSIDLFPKNEADVDHEVRQCSELIRLLHEYYSRKSELLLNGTQLILR
jgi:chemotaxis protein histidine kinase CheA